jgi:hypothetical protein
VEGESQVTNYFQLMDRLIAKMTEAVKS